MKHLVLLMALLAVFGTGSYFMVAKLHHGNVELEYERQVVDYNLAYLGAEELYPEDASAILYGEHGFDRVHPDFRKTSYIEEVFLPDAEVSSGWIFRGSGDNTKAKRVYCNDQGVCWESKWYHLRGDSFVSQDVLMRAHFGGTAVSPLASSSLGVRSETLFGKSAFEDLFPHSIRFYSINYMLPAEDSISGGWLAKDDDGETMIARVYRNDKGHWMSDWYHLDRYDYVAQGTLYVAQVPWDDSLGDNWPAIFGLLLIPCGLFLAFYFALEYALNMQDS